MCGFNQASFPSVQDSNRDPSPSRSGKIDFQQTVVWPLTMRCSLEMTDFQVCPATEHEGGFTVHSADVEARVVHTHWIKNQLWRIAIGNLRYR